MQSGLFSCIAPWYQVHHCSNTPHTGSRTRVGTWHVTIVSCSANNQTTRQSNCNHNELSSSEYFFWCVCHDGYHMASVASVARRYLAYTDLQPKPIHVFSLNSELVNTELWQWYELTYRRIINDYDKFFLSGSCLKPFWTLDLEE